MKLGVFTLGCKVNLYESEIMMNAFKSKGYEICNFEDICDVYIINTCTVTNNADSKCRKIINKARSMNQDAVICVVGCYSQVSSDEIKEKLNVDIILGTKDKTLLPNYVAEFLKEKKQISNIYDIREAEFEDMTIFNLESRTRAFIKIQDGCNNFCSYCIIPYARGGVRSKDKNILLKEIIELTKKGYKEIVLTGIHTGGYGQDLDNYSFSDLLEDIFKNKKLKRLRISSIEVTELDNKFFEILKNEPRLVNHLHIPIQSGSNNVLKLMNRKYTLKEYFSIIEKIRTIRPKIAISTDLIIGHPGETEENFKEVVDTLEKIKFSKVHIFPYSKRKNTKAFYMKNHIDGNIKKNRIKQVSALSKILEIEYMNKFLNEELEVLVEKCENKICTGHTSNYILVKFEGEYNSNDLVKVNLKKVNYPIIEGKVI
ncbi:MAG: tRNA (N(6)-L-threonylcarbamoyladenosine(37)-C(2))-methylthiotransferase MtaB [Bacilli bacterium]